MHLLVAHFAMSAVSVLHGFTQEMAINDLDQTSPFPSRGLPGSQLRSLKGWCGETHTAAIFRVCSSWINNGPHSKIFQSINLQKYKYL